MLAAGERQETPRQVGTAHRSPLGGLNALPGDGVLAHRVFEQVEVAHDHPQHIIEIMG